MPASLDPITLAIVAGVVVLVLVGVAVVVLRRRRPTTADPVHLPLGAEAALLSVTEVMPDPRNHLAIKDPTSELRLTPEERQAAADAAAAARNRRSPDRPADRAAAERARAARVAALAKHEAKHGQATAAELAARRPPTTKAG